MQLGGKVQTVSWSPDGARLATQMFYSAKEKPGMSVTYVHDAATGDTVAIFPELYKVRWSPKGEQAAAHRSIGKLVVFSTLDDRWSQQHEFDEHQLYNYQYPKWSSSGTRLAFQADLMRVRCVCIATAETVDIDHRNIVTDLMWAPHDALLVTVTREPAARLWSPSGVRLATIYGRSIFTDDYPVAWDASGSVLRAAGVCGRELCIVDPLTGEPVAILGEMELGDTRRGLVPITWCADGTRLLTTTNGCHWKLWDASGWKEVHAFDAECAAVSEDGKRAAFVHDGCLRLLDLVSLASHVLDDQVAPGECNLTWSPDGARLASTCADSKTVSVREVPGLGAEFPGSAMSERSLREAPPLEPRASNPRAE